MSYHLFRDVSWIFTLEGAYKKQGRNINFSDLSREKNQSFLVNKKGLIVWKGELKKLPPSMRQDVVKETSLKHKIIIPGLVECHTHSIFAGQRANEFELRNQGVSYQEISAKGGGILSTVNKTRKATEKELLIQGQKNVDRFSNQGVTTLEIKSGYALDLKNEIKMLKVAKQLKGPEIITTFLGAHALAPEFNNYIDYLIYIENQVLPKLKKMNLTRRVDIFIEKGFFDVESSRKFLLKAKELGFDLVIHADQLSLSGGANLAVELNAKSAEHLIQIKNSEIKKLSRSDVTCVLLPSADLYMKCKYPPARKLIDNGARVALATDYNPGTSPSADINLVGLLARLEMKMTLPEVISAYTVGGAFALGIEKKIGSFQVGFQADFISLNREIDEIFYSIGDSFVDDVWKSGKMLKN